MDADGLYTTLWRASPPNRQSVFADLAAEDLGSGGNDWLARDEGLVDHAGESEHREAAVRKLGELKAWEALLVVTELERVEANVAGNLALVGEHVHLGVLALVVSVLEGRDGKEDLHQTFHRHRGDRLERVRVVPRVSWDREEFLDHVARGREHADAAVLELGLARPVAVDELGQVERVEASLRADKLRRLARRRLEEGKRLRGLRDGHVDRAAAEHLGRGGGGVDGASEGG